MYYSVEPPVSDHPKWKAWWQSLIGGGCLREVNVQLRWPNIVLIVCEYMSFVRALCEKGGSLEAWQKENIVMDDFNYWLQFALRTVSKAMWMIENNPKISLFQGFT